MNTQKEFRSLPSQVEHSLRYNPPQPAEAIPSISQSTERERTTSRDVPTELETYIRFTQGY